MFSSSSFDLKSLPALLLALAVMSIVFLSGCDLGENYLAEDRATNMDVQDFRDAMSPRQAEFESFASNEDIPPLESYVSPVSESLRPIPLVSVSVNQTIPLRDVLFELATQAGYDLELDPRISGSIIFTAKNRPFDIVIERISQIAGLRYEFEDDRLRVELDTPYTKTYKIDYLALVRSSSSNISNSLSVVSGEEAEAGSSFSIASEAEADFWGELETNLEQILTSNAGLGYLRTQNDPTISVAEANPQAPVVAVDGIDEVELEGEGPVPTPGQDQAQPPVVQAPNTVLQVQTLPQETETGSGTENPNEVSFTPAFSINRQAGLISVYANKRIHEQVNEYLTEVRRNATAQVLIEAKVLEVNLTDEFSAGINWNLLNSFFDSDLSIGFAGGTTAGLGLTPTATNALTLTYSGDNITSIVDAIARFGTVHALASPRLTVLNNQPAVLNVAQNIVYFTLDIERTDGTDDNPPTTTIDSEVNSVPEGVLINVIPSVNPDTQTITLQIRPTVTRVVDRAFDPATSVTLADSGLPTTLDEGIPELNVQEIDSILNMKSGQIAILGGLLQDRSDNTSESVPVLGEVPIVGNLFKARTSAISKTELVIFIKATIIDAPGSIHNTDKELYRTFAQDRRPLRF